MMAVEPILRSGTCTSGSPRRGRTVHAVAGHRFDLTRRRGAGARRRVGLRQEHGAQGGRGAAAAGGRRSSAARCSFEGRDLRGARRSRRRAVRGREIAMIFQDPMTALDPVIRVGDQIAEGPRRRSG